MKHSNNVSSVNLLTSELNSKASHYGLIDYQSLANINLAECRNVESIFADELKILEKYLQNPNCGLGATTIGSELEMPLVNKFNLLPSMVNVELCNYSNAQNFQPEISKFCLEYNGPIIATANQPLSTLMNEMNTSLNFMSKLAEDNFNTKLVTIGIIPTATTRDLGMDALTPSNRYYTVNKLIKLLRCDNDFILDIAGENPLRFKWYNSVVQGVNSSFQVHLRVNPQEYNNYYNAAQLIAGFVLSLSGNSPMLFGHKLWEETRIAVFEQTANNHSLHLGHLEEQPRVVFGRGWINQGVYGLFKEICELYYPIFMPQPNLDVNTKNMGPDLRHIRQHNSAIWTWNRPVYDPVNGGHFRIEMRYLPSGPTVQDMVINTGFMLGLTREFADNIESFTNSMSFKYAKYNFYQAAQYGLAAKFIWPMGNSKSLKEISVMALLDEMIHQAMSGLHKLGVSDLEIQYVETSLKLRFERKITGAIWQRKVFDNLQKKYKLDTQTALNQMFKQYISNQDIGSPVASWPMDI